MQVKMLTGMASADFALSPGDLHDCDEEEAGRLIAAGYAEAVAPVTAKKTSEKAVRVAPAETR